MRAIDADVLTLEPQTTAHAEEMFAVLSDPAIYEFENQPPPSVEWLRTRYAKLESRRSPDGGERWLNWVIRLRAGQLVGYVQATVVANGDTFIAYELASAHWGQGLAKTAVGAILTELFEHDQIRRFWAVLKRDNYRSVRLLERLGFAQATLDQHATHGVPPDEVLYTLCRRA
jgi:[ribosomal protein S5]-alanine N-acetyltransferase